MSDTLLPIFGPLAIAAVYVAIAGAIILGITAAKAQMRAALGALGISVVVGAVALLLVRLDFFYRTLSASLLVIVLEVAVYRLMLKPRFGWANFKEMRACTRQTILHMVLLSGAFIFVLPFVWLVSTSLKEDSQMSKFPPEWLPTQQVEIMVSGAERKLSTTGYEGKTVRVATMQEHYDGTRDVQIVTPVSLKGVDFVTKESELNPIRHVAPLWSNYSDALKFLPADTDYGLVFLENTLIVTSLSIIGTLLSSSMVAYGFSRLKWPGRDVTFTVVLATMMLPAAVTMMPVFLIFRWMGWIDTLKPLWFPSFFASAFNVFLLRQFFLGIPTELEDAAKIDGCSPYLTYWRIMLPLIKPALAALTIMGFMGAWNDFRGPLIYISSPSKETLAYALQLFQNSHGGEPGMMMAASTMVMVPVLVLFFFTQRYFIEGITLTGIKG